jgi:uncharacterized protein YndB with AHSA1/START domain
MKSSLLFDFTVDKVNNKVNVTREFAAPLTLVWKAWTTAELLDQWWAPRPYTNTTLSMNFSNGGRWHYFMTSPEGQKHYCLADYNDIITEKEFKAIDAFCDENAVITQGFLDSNWHNSFKTVGDITRVDVVISYKNLEQLETIIKMGFKEGFTMGLGNLEELLENLQK